MGLSSFPEDEDDQADWEVPQAAIPLPPVEGAILAKVIEYCTYHTENKEAKEDERDAWDKKFAGVDDDTLFSLILAANYLDIKPLLDLTCKTVADYIKACKTPQEIRRRSTSRMISHLRKRRRSARRMPGAKSAKHPIINQKISRLLEDASTRRCLFMQKV